MNGKQAQQLTGGMAVGAGLVVLFTHGGTYTLEEVAILMMGMGALVTYVVNVVELLVFGRDLTFNGRAKPADPPDRAAPGS